MSRKRYRALAVSTGVLFLGLALASCGEEKSSPQEAVAPAISRRAAIRLDTVASDLTVKCMRAKGWTDYRETLPTEAELNVAEAATNQAYGLDDVAFRKRYGADAYRLADGSPGYLDGGDSPGDTAPGSGPSATDAEREFSDLNGTGPWIEVRTPTSGTISSPSGGCYAEARKNVYGPKLKEWLTVNSLVVQFNGMAVNEALDSDEYKAQVRQWAKCMKEKGWSRVSDTERGADRDMPDADRDDFSVDDATCGARFQVQSTGERLQRDARNRIYQRYEGQLLAWNEFVLAAQTRVEQLR